MVLEVRTRPVTTGNLPELAELFQVQRNTRHCWCTAFCTTRTRFALGWLRGGNRSRFEAMAGASPTPVGVLASATDGPVGWAACGPRSRYVAAVSPRNPLTSSRSPAEDDDVWLLPCLVVRAEARGQGVTHRLVGAAVQLARQHGAVAVEGWPLARAAGPSADAFVGREELFDALGFRCVDRPVPGRVIMRLEL